MSTAPHGPETPRHNIVAFETYLSAMTYPLLAEMRQYWDSLRGGRQMPLRSEIDPREMSSFLEQCFVLEHRQSGDTRFRLAGIGLCDIMGMELRGAQLRSMIEPSDRAWFSARIEQLFQEPEIQTIDLRSTSESQPALAGRMLILPLKDDCGQINRAIGCLVTTGIVGLNPRRFQISAFERKSLKSGRVQRDKPSRVSDELLAGFTEPAAPYLDANPVPAIGAETGVPYLKLVK